MSDVAVPLVLSAEPFSRSVAHLSQPAGRTVRAALVDAVRAGELAIEDLSRTVVYVDGARLDRDATLAHILREGQVVNVVVEPLGGGRGKDVGQILLTIAVIVVSAWVGGPAGIGLGLKSALVRTVAAAAVMTLGNAAVAALFAPDTKGQASVNDRYALQSASNQFRPWSPFPLALGEVVIAPDFAVKTFTRTLGDDVWLYGILGLHYGPCEITDLKIGDTLVSSMGDGEFLKVEHLTPGPRTFSLCPNDVNQTDFQEQLEANTSSATTIVRSGESEGELFEFDFFLPSGLYFQKDDGRLLAAAVSVAIRYRPVDEAGVPTGAGTWSAGLTVSLSSTTREPWRVTRGLSLPMGRYEFDFTRSLKPDTNEKRRDLIALTAIRAIAYRKPIVDETLSVVEFAVRASALNQGTLAPITCRLTPHYETWDPEDEVWTDPVATSNPAAAMRGLLTGPAAARPLAPEQADVQLRAWSVLCDEYDWKAGLYLAEERTQAEAVALLDQAGRASTFWDGTQIVASPWVEKPAPRQIFTGANLRDHRWTLDFPEPVHALRVEFQNLDESGEPDELYVYADGYAETADVEEELEAATLIEVLRLEGQKTAERAWRDGRWELGRRKHQRRVDTWTADVENVVSRYGDRVRLAWQRVDGGLGIRVRCRRWTGELVSGLRLDQPVEMLPGESYAVDLRMAGEEIVTAVAIINPASTDPVVTREIAFAVPRTAVATPARGGLLAFGVATRVSEDVELIGIEPGEDLSAVLTGVRYVAPLLMTGETGPIPELQTRLSLARRASPPTPRVLGVQADPAGVRVSFALPPWTGAPISGFAARWRPTPGAGQESGWISLPALDAVATTLVTPPPRALPSAVGDDEGSTLIDVEIRALTVAGHSSPVPLLIEGIEVREDPFVPLNQSVTPATRVAPDGSSHGVLVFSVDPLLSAVGIDVIVEVRRYPPGGGAPDAWESAGLPLTSINPVGDIPGLRAGTAYGVRGAFRSAGGWISDWTDEEVGTVPAGSNVSADVNPNSPAMLEVFYRQIDEVLASTLRIVDEQQRRASDTTDTQRFIDRIGVVNPATGRVDLRAENLFAGRLSMATVDERVAEGFEDTGQIRQPVPRDVSELSGIYNEQIEITPEGELVINNPGGPVTGGQVLRVQEATGFVGHDAFFRRSPTDPNLGGRTFHQKPLINTSLTGDLAFDVYQSAMRWFDATTLYGVTLPFSAFQPSIGGRIVVSTAAGTVVGDVGSTTALRAPYARIGNNPGDGFVTLNEGDATYSGRAEFYNGAGTRLGYIGFGSGSTLVMAAEGAVTWAFDKQVRMLAGAAVTGDATVSGKLALGTTAVTARLGVTDGGVTNPVIRAEKTVGGGDALQLGSTFVGGNTVALNPFISGVSNAGFEIAIAGTQRIVIDGSGYVGFGTAAPQTLLHAAGPIRAGAGSIGYVQLEPGDATYSGRVDFKNAAGTRIGYAGFGSGTTLVMAAEGAFTWAFDKQVRMLAGAEVTGDITTTAAIHAASFVRVRNGSSGYIQHLPGDADYTGYTEFCSAGGTRYAYLGYINTSSKDVLFASENGAKFAFTGGSLRVETANSSAYNPSTAGFSLRKNNEGYGLFAGVEGSGNSWLQAGTASNGTYDLILQGIGGKVGINTAAPETALHVAGGIRARNGAVGFIGLESGDATNTGYLAFNNAAGTRYGYIGLVNTTAKVIDFRAENAAVFQFTGGAVTIDNSLSVTNSITTSADAGGLLTLGRYSGGYPWALVRPDATATGFEFRSNAGTALLNINQSSGFVGISTPAPATRLSNSATKTTGSVSDLGLNWNITEAGTYAAGFKNNGALGKGIHVESGGGHAIVTEGGGFVGINTTAPLRLLDVNGTTNFRDTVRFDNGASGLISWTTGYSDGTTLVFDGPSGGGFAIRPNGGTVALFAKSNGYIGIGTASPTAKAHIDDQSANVPGLLIHKTVGGNPGLRLTTSFAGGSTVDLESGVPGVSNGGFAITVDTVRRMSFAPGADTYFNVATGCGFHWSVNGSDVALLEANGRLSINLLSIGGANFDPASKVGMTGAETVAGVKTFSSIPVAGGLTTTGGDMNFRVDTGQGYRWKVNGTDVALLEASGRLSLNAITMGGLGLGEWADWTPTPVAESGTATGLAFVYAEVERHGKSVTVNFAVSQTAIGTGAAAILVPAPYAAKASRNFFGSGKNLNTGADLRVEAAGSNLRITAANSYPFGSGAESLAGSITYQCA